MSHLKSLSFAGLDYKAWADARGHGGGWDHWQLLDYRHLPQGVGAQAREMQAQRTAGAMENH